MTIEETIAAAVEARIRPLVDELRAAVAENRANADSDDGYLSVEKAAKLAEVHPDTIRGWMKAGKLTEYHAGRELRIRRSDLHRFLASNNTTSTRSTVVDEANEILNRRKAKGG